MSSRIELLFNDFVRTGLYLRNWSPRTVRTYKQALSSFQQSLGYHGSMETLLNVEGGSPTKALLEVRELITKNELSNWIIWLRNKGVTPGGCNMYIRTINSFLSWLHTEQYLEQKLKLKLLSNPPRPLKGFSQNEIRSLLSFRPRGFTEFRTWVLTQTLMDTGVRIEELLTLRTTECDFDNTLLTVVGKGNKVRRVPFSLELRKILWRYIQAKDKRGINKISFLFCTNSGSRLSYRNTYRDIKNLCKRVGIEGHHVHPHAFRHHFAVTYIRRGGDLYRLSRILGHTSVTTTQLYLRSMGIEQISENHSSLTPLVQR